MPSAENRYVLWKLTHAGWSGQPYLETFLYYPKYKPGSHMGESLREAAKTWKKSGNWAAKTWKNSPAIEQQIRILIFTLIFQIAQ